MTPVEPVWFYSTLAQTAAAIIGLVGVFLVALLVHQTDRSAGLHRELVVAARAFATEARSVIGRYALYRSLCDRLLAPRAGEALITLPLLPRIAGASTSGPVELRRNREVDAVLKTIANHAVWLERSLGGPSLAAVFGEGRADIRAHLTQVIGEQAAAEQRSILLEAPMPLLTQGGRAQLERLLDRLDRFHEVQAQVRSSLSPGIFRVAVALMALLGVSCLALPLIRLAERIDGREFTITVGALALVFVATLASIWIRSGALERASVVSATELGLVDAPFET